MLNKLFGSKSRVKILKLFLTHPDERFYIRQIARDLKLQLNSARRELDNLEQFGLLASNPDDGAGEDGAMSRAEFIRDIKPKAKSRAGKKVLPAKLDKKYYQTNKNFILYEEIKSLIVKAQMLYERDFVEKVNAAGNPKLMVLTGFFVNSEKPIDLLLVGRFNRRKVLRVIRDLERELGREVNYSIMSIREFKYRRDITDVFLFDILESDKLTVVDEFGVS